MNFTFYFDFLKCGYQKTINYICGLHLISVGQEL